MDEYPERGPWLWRMVKRYGLIMVFALVALWMVWIALGSAR